jgi:hypothetical protein
METGSGSENFINIRIKEKLKNDFFSIENFENLIKHFKVPDNLKELVKRLIQPNSNAYEIINNVQLLGEATFHSYRKIDKKEEKNKILFFVCSSIASLNKKTLNQSLNSKGSTENSEKKNLSRNKKRENHKSCPMKLKFKLDETTQKYTISKTSNLCHNHSPMCNDSKVKINKIKSK